MRPCSPSRRNPSPCATGLLEHPPEHFPSPVLSGVLPRAAAPCEGPPLRPRSSQASTLASRGISGLPSPCPLSHPACRHMPFWTSHRASLNLSGVSPLPPERPQLSRPSTIASPLAIALPSYPPSRPSSSRASALACPVFSGAPLRVRPCDFGPFRRPPLRPTTFRASPRWFAEPTGASANRLPSPRGLRASNGPQFQR